MRAEDLEFFENLVGKENIDAGFGRQYNLFAMEEGIKIAEALQTKDEILRFSNLDWDEQLKLVPTLDDGHSGNTFGMACRFAIAYLPQLLVNRRDERIDSIIQ
jgi:hypothetical protein